MDHTFQSNEAELWTAPVNVRPMAHFKEEWQFARGLTLDLLHSLSEEDLSFSPCEAVGPLWKQFRHAGRVQEDYMRALDTGVVEFDVARGSFTGTPTIEDLEAYLADLDCRLFNRLETLDSSRSISWCGEEVPVYEHLMRLVNHETLHNGQWIVYLRLLAKPFPPSWGAWGL